MNNYEEITITGNETEFVAKHKDFEVIGVGSNEFEAVLELSKALGALMFSKDYKHNKVTELLGLYQTYHYEPSEINQRIQTLEKELGNCNH